MTAKERILQFVNNLPENASIEGAMDRLLLLAKVECWLQQDDVGQTISHSEFKERLAKWLK